MRIKYIIIIVFLLAVLLPEAFAQDGWELKRNEDGIEVYTRRLNDEKFKEIRIITNLPGTASQLVSVVTDIDNQKDWVFGIKNSYLLKKVKDKHIIYYNEIDLPWPASDRDLINELKVYKDPITAKTVIQSKGLSNHIPAKKGLIRIPYATAHWDITPVAEKEIKVVYTFSVDPGGSLPAWLVNSIATMAPYNSFMELRKILSKMNE